MKIFLSFHFDARCPEYEYFVYRLKYYLKKQLELDPYCFTGARRWTAEVSKAVKECEGFVLIVGREVGNVQRQEAKAFQSKHTGDLDRSVICVVLPDSVPLPNCLTLFLSGGTIRVQNVCNQNTNHTTRKEDISEDEAEECARQITEKFLGRGNWIHHDGLPIGYPFNYEKVIIEDFVKGKGTLVDPKRLASGCPQSWPDVAEIGARQGGMTPNPVSEDIIGSYRPRDARIIVDTRTQYHDELNCCLAKLKLTFLEAGPRKDLLYPLDTSPDRLRVGILVSGGIAPGINAVITGIVERHQLYADEQNNNGSGNTYKLEILGYRDGFSGILKGTDPTRLTKDEVRKWADRGGSIISTSRHEKLLESSDPAKGRERIKELTRLVRKLDGIDILYILGGDGGMKAAHAISTIAQKMANDDGGDRNPISVVAIPKTMDNDILWVWQSFGFLSAVEKAREFIMELHTEVLSNPRLCIMQLFGSDSGFVVSHAALASGVCDLALIPESRFNMKKVSSYILSRLKNPEDPNRRGKSPYGLILMAETAIPVLDKDLEKRRTLLDDKDIQLEEGEKEAIEEFIRNDCRVYGQTPDELRTAGLKIVSRVLKRDIRSMSPSKDWAKFRVFTNEPRHLIRAINPSVQDVIFGQRLGCLAVDNAMAGYTDFMISQWQTEFVLIPLKLVVLGRKRVPGNGIFWKSVINNTKQHALVVPDDDLK